MPARATSPVSTSSVVSSGALAPSRIAEGVYSRVCRQRGVKPNAFFLRQVSLGLDMLVSLRVLDFSGTFLGASGALAALDLAAAHQTLQRLILVKNGLDAACAQRLADVVRRHRSLAFIDISDNAFSTPSARLLCDLAREVPRLQELTFARCSVDEVWTERAERHLRANRELHDLGFHPFGVPRNPSDTATAFILVIASASQRRRALFFHEECIPALNALMAPLRVRLSAMLLDVDAPTATATPAADADAMSAAETAQVEEKVRLCCDQVNAQMPWVVCFPDREPSPRVLAALQTAVFGRQPPVLPPLRDRLGQLRDPIHRVAPNCFVYWPAVPREEAAKAVAGPRQGTGGLSSGEASPSAAAPAHAAFLNDDDSSAAADEAIAAASNTAFAASPMIPGTTGGGSGGGTRGLAPFVVVPAAVAAREEARRVAARQRNAMRAAAHVACWAGDDDSTFSLRLHTDLFTSFSTAYAVDPANVLPPVSAIEQRVRMDTFCVTNAASGWQRPRDVTELVSYFMRPAAGGASFPMVFYGAAGSGRSFVLAAAGVELLTRLESAASPEVSSGNRAISVATLAAAATAASINGFGATRNESLVFYLVPEAETASIVPFLVQLLSWFTSSNSKNGSGVTPNASALAAAAAAALPPGERWATLEGLMTRVHDAIANYDPEAAPRFLLIGAAEAFDNAGRRFPLSLDWLPLSFPPNVRIVLSVATDSPLLHAMRKRSPQPYELLGSAPPKEDIICRIAAGLASRQVTVAGFSFSSGSLTATPQTAFHPLPPARSPSPAVGGGSVDGMTPRSDGRGVPRRPNTFPQLPVHLVHPLHQPTNETPPAESLVEGTVVSQSTRAPLCFLLKEDAELPLYADLFAALCSQERLPAHETSEATVCEYVRSEVPETCGGIAQRLAKGVESAYGPLARDVLLLLCVTALPLADIVALLEEPSTKLAPESKTETKVEATTATEGTTPKGPTTASQLPSSTKGRLSVGWNADFLAGTVRAGSIFAAPAPAAPPAPPPAPLGVGHYPAFSCIPVIVALRNACLIVIASSSHARLRHAKLRSAILSLYNSAGLETLSALVMEHLRRQVETRAAGTYLDAFCALPALCLAHGQRSTIYRLLHDTVLLDDVLRTDGMRAHVFDGLLRVCHHDELMCELGSAPGPQFSSTHVEGVRRTIQELQAMAPETGNVFQAALMLPSDSRLYSDAARRRCAPPYPSLRHLNKEVREASSAAVVQTLAPPETSYRHCSSATEGGQDHFVFTDDTGSVSVCEADGSLLAIGNSFGSAGVAGDAPAKPLGAFSAGGDLIVVSLAASIVLWNYRCDTRREIAGYSCSVRRDALSGDRSLLVCIEIAQQRAFLLDVVRGKILSALPAAAVPVREAHYCGPNVAVISLYDVTLFTASGGVATLAHPSLIRAVASSPDGKLVAVCSGTVVYVWSDTAVCFHVCSGHRAEVADVAFHPNGSLFVTCSEDATVRVWYTLTGQEYTRLQTHVGSCEFCCFTPDATKLVARCGRYLRMWDTITFEDLGAVVAHEGALVQHVATASAHLFTVPTAGTPKVWSLRTLLPTVRQANNPLATNDLLRVSFVTPVPIHTVAVSPARGVVAVLDAGHTLRLFRSARARGSATNDNATQQSPAKSADGENDGHAATSEHHADSSSAGFGRGVSPPGGAPAAAGASLPSAKARPRGSFVQATKLAEAGGVDTEHATKVAAPSAPLPSCLALSRLGTHSFACVTTNNELCVIGPHGTVEHLQPLPKELAGQKQWTISCGLRGHVPQAAATPMAAASPTHAAAHFAASDATADELIACTVSLDNGPRIVVFSLPALRGSLQLVSQIVGHRRDVTSLHFLRKTILTSSLDGTIRLWSQQSNAERHCIPHSDPVLAFALLAPPRTFLLCDAASNVLCVDVDEDAGCMKVRRAFPGLRGRYIAAAVIRDSVVCLAGADGALYVADASRGRLVNRIASVDTRVACIATRVPSACNSIALACGTEGGHVNLFELMEETTRDHNVD